MDIISATSLSKTSEWTPDSLLWGAVSQGESLRLLLDGLIVDVARRFRSPGTQQGRLKALRLSGLGPPWTGGPRQCNRSSRHYIKNRAGAKYALFSFWAKTCRVRPPGILSFRHYEFLGRSKKRSVRWFDPLVLLSRFFTASSPIPCSSWICSCGQARTRLG